VAKNIVAIAEGAWRTAAALFRRNEDEVSVISINQWLKK